MILLNNPAPARVSEAIVRFQALGQPHPVPLFRALLADELALALLAPGDRLPLAILDPTHFHKPLVILLGGDGGADGMTDCGPEGWRQSRRLLLWSRWTLIHATGGEAWHYQAAVEAVRKFRRVLIAECGTASLRTWLALRAEVAPKTSGMIVKTRPGDFHPLCRNTAEGVAR